MYVENELVEFVTVGEQEYEEVIEEYEEEVLVTEPTNYARLSKKIFRRSR